MTLKKITGKDIKEAVDWLWKNKEDGGCIHHVLGTTDDGTKLCFVVGWSDGRDYGDDDKKYGYFDEGYCISAKIGYQHRNNAMQSDYEWDFNMPYDTKTGDVWDTSSYVPRDADWEREAADYNKEAQKIWDTYGKPDKNGTTALDLMESKKSESAKGSMRRKIESLVKKNEGAGDTIKVTAENVMLTVNGVYVDEHGGSFSVETPEEGKSYNLLDMQEIIRGMCEDCTGYANYSRDGSDILIEVMAGEMDDSGEWTGDYYKAYSFRCTARIMSYSLEGITDFLDESN